jgi:hypothetical protein
MHGMPKPQAEHEKLAMFAGRWQGDEKLEPSPWDPKPGTATGHLESRLALGGFFVISDYHQERDGKTTYEGHGVYGYDPQERVYTMWWADSLGPMVGLAKGRFEGNTLAFSNQTPRGHGRYTYIFDGPERVTFRLEHSQDGKDWQLFLEARYRKR